MWEFGFKHITDDMIFGVPSNCWQTVVILLNCSRNRTMCSTRRATFPSLTCKQVGSCDCILDEGMWKEVIHPLLGLILLFLCLLDDRYQEFGRTLRLNRGMNSRRKRPRSMRDSVEQSKRVLPIHIWWCQEWSINLYYVKVLKCWDYML